MTLLMIPHYSPIPNAFWELSTCLCYKGVCTPAEWKCASGECLPENQRCDGITQCSDGSDEDLCGNYMTAFACNCPQKNGLLTALACWSTPAKLLQISFYKKNIANLTYSRFVGIFEWYDTLIRIIYPIRYNINYSACYDQVWII